MKKLFFLLSFLIFVGCKSNVEEKSSSRDQGSSTLRVEGLSKISVNHIRSESLREDSLPTAKDFQISACFADSLTRESLRFQDIEVTLSGKNYKDRTDSSGCLTFTKRINIDYVSDKKCFKDKVQFKYLLGEVSSSIRYEIDVFRDEVFDLRKTSGCQESKQIENEKQRQPFTDSKITTLKRNNKLYFNKILFSVRSLKRKPRSDVRNLPFSYRINSCMNSDLRRRVFSTEKFQITITDDTNKKTIYPVDKFFSGGCFELKVDEEYAQYDYSHWKERTIELEILSGPLKGNKAKTKYFINPWEGNYKDFGIDSLYGRIRPDENEEKRPAKFFVDGVMYIVIGNDQKNFKVDESLGLTIKKKYQVVLNPKINVGHRFSNPRGLNTIPVQDGKFKLSFVLLAPENNSMEINYLNYKNFTYITGAEEIVEVQNGTINTLLDIPVKLTDLPRLSTRTVSVFKLEPIDDIGLEKTVVTGFFQARIGWIKTNVFQESYSSYDVNKYEQKVDSVWKQIENGKFPEMNFSFNPESFENDLNDIQDSIKEGVIPSYSPKEVASYNDIFSSEGGNFLKSPGVRKKEYRAYLENVLENIETLNSERLKSYDFSRDPKDIYMKALEVSNKNIPIEKYNTNTFLWNEKSKVVISEDVFSEIFSKKIFQFLPFYHDKYSLDKAREHWFDFDREDERYKNYKNIDYTTSVMKGIIEKLCAEALPEYKKGASFKKGNAVAEAAFRDCRNNPDRYFEIIPTIHTREVQSIRPIKSEYSTLSLSSRVSAYEGEGKAFYVTRRVGVDFGLKLPMKDIVGFGLKAESSETSQDSEYVNLNTGKDVSVSKNIVVENFEIDVNGSFERCITIIPTGKPFNIGSYNLYASAGISFYRKRAEPPKGNFKINYICSDKLVTKANEVWYFIQSEHSGTSFLRDPYGPGEIRLMKVIRGRENYNAFKRAYEDNSKLLYTSRNMLKNRTIEDELYELWGYMFGQASFSNEELIEFERHIDGSYPGTINH